MRKLLHYTPHTYLCKLGAEVYDRDYKLLSEMSIILHYVFDQSDHKEATDLWDLAVHDVRHDASDAKSMSRGGFARGGAP